MSRRKVNEPLNRLFNIVLKAERMPEKCTDTDFKEQGLVQSCSHYRGINVMGKTDARGKL